MTLNNIRKAIFRNLGQLSSDNETIIEGLVTKGGVDDEINNYYREIIAQELMARNGQDFTVEARNPTFRESFTVASVDVDNKFVTSTTSIFGVADVGSKIQNPTNGNSYTITQINSGNQVTISETPISDWVGDTAYILNNILVLTGDMADFKEILKVQIKYNSTDSSYRLAKKETPTNFEDYTDQDYGTDNFWGTPIYTVSTIKVNDKMQRCLKYYPRSTNYNGEIKILYTQLPAPLVQDSDEPSLSIIGASQLIINAVTAWGFRLQNDPQKAQAFEELFRVGLQQTVANYKPDRAAPIRYKGFKR
jgi:hypothetical protein